MKILVKRTGTENFSSPTSSNLEEQEQEEEEEEEGGCSGAVVSSLPVGAEAAVVAPGVRGGRELEGVDQDEDQH